MEKVLKIEGMSCKNCVKHVKESLEAIDGVTAVDISLESKTAAVTLSKDVEQSVFAEAIDDAGYELI